MTAVDRYPHGDPVYTIPVGKVQLNTTVQYQGGGYIIRGNRFLAVMPSGPTPLGPIERRRYGRHSHAHTKAYRRSDPRRWHQVQDAIRSVVSVRQELRRTGQPLTTRSAS